MLDYIIAQTDKFISSKPKATRKSFGQFFTSKNSARFMAEMFCIPHKRTVSILDPGAGSGILSAAVIEVIENKCPTVKEIELTCFENNSDIIPLLEKNIEYLKSTSRMKITVKIITENYIFSQADDFSETLMASCSPRKYDMVIGNPPYHKMAKNA